MIFLIFSQSQDKGGVSALNFSKLKDVGEISEFFSSYLIEGDFE